MKLKTLKTADGVDVAEIKDGKPVYIGDDGKEIAFDAPHALGKISQLNGEAQGHREAQEALEQQFAPFKNIKDPDAALKAMETVRNLDESKLVEAGKVEEIKAAAVRAAKEQTEAAIKAKDDEYAPIVQERDALKGSLHNEMVGGGFARSKFVQDNIAIPVDMLQATFGGRFAVEGGKIVAKDAEGQKIYSRAKPGDLAGFDEALSMMVEQYPYKDQIMKGRGHNGAGSQHTGNGSAGEKTIQRSTWDTMSQGDRAAKSKDGYKVVDG